MIIRNYKSRDFKDIKEIIDEVNKVECWPFYHPNGWNEERINEEFSPLDKYKDSIFFVVENEGKVVGLIVGHKFSPFLKSEINHLEEFFKELISKENIYYERDILVNPKYYNKGVGSLLFEKLKIYAKDKGYKKLITRTPPLNQRGRNFFQKQGFKEILNDDKPPRVYLIKEL